METALLLYPKNRGKKITKLLRKLVCLLMFPFKEDEQKEEISRLLDIIKLD